MTNTETKRRELLSAIKTQAKALGLSDEAVAQKCGMKQQSINRMLSGKFSPKLDNIITIAHAVGLSIELSN